MTKNKQNVPQVRFKGFTDDWEQRKLEEVITVGNGMDYKHLSEGDIPVYGTGGYMLSVDKALSYDKDAIGIGRKGTIDKPYVLKAPFWTVDTLFYCIPKEDYSLDFVYCIFQNVNWKDKDESTGVPSLSKVNINSTDVKVPALAEQQQIGAYFRTLDTLITLHQRKCETLQKLKKSMLQKMFPKNGSHFPEIRFKGFTDAWELRKFSELYEKNMEKNSDLIGFDKTISIATMTYKDEGNGASDSSLSAYKVLRIGDIAFEGHTSKEFRYGRFVANDIGIGLMSPRFSTLRPIKEMPVDFWKHYIHYEPIMKYILVNATKAGTMMNELVIPEFLEQSLLVPSLKEQAKIGQYFTTLDHLITLHQRKLETLKKLKKAMLQKMFI